MQKEDVMAKELVSIIMISHNNANYVGESVNSVLTQTYQNWELLAVDDASTDNTLEVLLDFLRKDRRVTVTQNVFNKGKRHSENYALKDVKGQYVAFLNVGDTWEPTKLEKQIAFMKEHGYFYTYTEYRLMDSQSKDMGIIQSGLNRVTKKDMLKCCWPGYLTVIYDAKNLGLMQVKFLKISNEYALLLQVSEKADCYLLKECLANNRVYNKLTNRLSLLNKFKWRYDVYRVIEKMNPIKSFSMACANVYCTLRKMKVYRRKG